MLSLNESMLYYTTGDATGRLERSNAPSTPASSLGSSTRSTNSSASFGSANSDTLPWPEMKPTSNAFYSSGTLSGCVLPPLYEHHARESGKLWHCFLFIPLTGVG